MEIRNACQLQLPAWVDDFVEAWPGELNGDAGGMRLAIGLAGENVVQKSGGPFAAAVIDESRAALVSVGVNMVTVSHLSVAHAEIIAISLAQQRLGDWNLSRHGNLTLLTSCEPCAMCFGAVPWSGIRRLVCGSRKEDAEAAGFDEGDKPRTWADSLRRRGIQVTRDVLRAEASELFRQYARHGGVIYNAGSGR